jgi:hypothetical protein
VAVIVTGGVVVLITVSVSFYVRMAVRVIICGVSGGVVVVAVIVVVRFSVKMVVGVTRLAGAVVVTEMGDGGGRGTRVEECRH